MLIASYITLVAFIRSSFSNELEALDVMMAVLIGFCAALLWPGTLALILICGIVYFMYKGMDGKSIKITWE